MNFFILTLVAFAGASVGSFISVANYRLQKNKKGILFGHSQCTSCKKQLKWFNLIPIFSYIFQGGKCSYCRKKISFRYFVLEVISALLLTSFFLKYPFLSIEENLITFDSLFLIYFVIYGLISLVLTAIFFYDLETKKIPNLYLIILGISAATGAVITGNNDFFSILAALMIATTFFGGQIILSKGTWLGEGDFYLCLAFALLLGWQQFIVFICFSYFIGALISAPLLIMKKAKMDTAIPFAPFLVAGFLATVFFGDFFWTFYFNINL